MTVRRLRVQYRAVADVLRSPETPSRLTISAIETIPIRVPLARDVPRAHYRMTHRSTIVTRRHTEEGIVGEAYAGDEDADAGRDRRDHPRRRSRRGSSGRTPSPSSAAGSSRGPRPSTSCATAGSGSSPCACVDTAIWDAVGKALGQPLWRLWGGYRDRAPGDLHRRLLRHRASPIADEIAELPRARAGRHASSRSAA